MVEAQLVQNRGVQVRHGHDVFDGAVSQFARRAVNVAPFEAAAG